ncbi:Metallo-beta-lactamase family protein, RNA-specific [Clostridiaceae bacterium JG1575]|nr:Metallo-beta-lactamase family protein, RNA-specific [Clostridiaceae bacterium JG1575]
MNLEFSGAAGCVTGSAHLVEVGGRKVLLDCGLYQGADAKGGGNEEFSFDPASIDLLILSHAHIDHSGRIPLLYQKGFRGRILCTPPTKDLCDIMLRDSAYIQEQDAERDNRKRLRHNEAPLKPLYTIEDAAGSLALFEAQEYGKISQPLPGVSVRFSDAGHMLGSAFVELFLKEEGEEEIRFVFSGDIGNRNVPLMTDPTTIDEADVVLMESTYGDRLHEAQESENERLLEIINSTVARGGNVVIPSFAVGRTQEILYVLNRFSLEGRLDSRVNVFVDSPLASKATAVFDRHSAYFDEEAQEMMRHGDNVLSFPQLHFTETVEDSRKLNHTSSGLVILSASGMAEAGRVRHHLKHNLWRPECSVVFVGYQAQQTLGRILLDGAKEVKIFGEPIAVLARITQIHGLSGHADQKGLLEFAQGFHKKVPKKIFLIHGDDTARQVLAAKLREMGLTVSLPMPKERFEIRDLKDLARPDATRVISASKIEQSAHLKEKLINEIHTMDLYHLTQKEILDRLQSVLSDHAL